MLAAFDIAGDGPTLDLRAVISQQLAPPACAQFPPRALHELPRGLYFSHRRDRGVTSRQAGLVVRVLDAARVRATSSGCVSVCRRRSRSAPRSSTWRRRICRARRGRHRARGENRAQELLAKQERHRDLFTWDFIGALQSRKVKNIAPNVRLIHSLASDSALERLRRHPAAEVLVQVNVAGEDGKEGIAPRSSASSSPVARSR